MCVLAFFWPRRLVFFFSEEEVCLSLPLFCACIEPSLFVLVWVFGLCLGEAGGEDERVKLFFFLLAVCGLVWVQHE